MTDRDTAGLVLEALRTATRYIGQLQASLDDLRADNDVLRRQLVQALDRIEQLESRREAGR